MRFAVTLLVSLCFLAGCVPKSDLEASQAANTELKNQVAAKDKQLTELQGKLADLSSKLNDRETQIAYQNKAGTELVQRLAAATQELARKPALPVTVRLRKALIGGGYVAVFSTTVKQELALLITLKSRALGTSRQFQLRVPATGSADLGSMEGALIDPADEIVVENTNYEKAGFHFQ
jgi:septal ring factor EnvC (AmiA/AmiB activator)